MTLINGMGVRALSAVQQDILGMIGIRMTHAADATRNMLVQYADKLKNKFSQKLLTKFEDGILLEKLQFLKRK